MSTVSAKDQSRETHYKLRVSIVQLDCFALARERSPYALTPHCQHELTRHHRTGQKEYITARHEMRQLLKSKERSREMSVHGYHETHVIPVYIIGTLFAVSLIAGLFFACRGRIFSKLGHFSYINTATTQQQSTRQREVKNYSTIRWLWNASNFTLNFT